jgi:hypothetical protein
LGEGAVGGGAAAVGVDEDLRGVGAHADGDRVAAVEDAGLADALAVDEGTGGAVGVVDVPATLVGEEEAVVLGDVVGGDAEGGVGGAADDVGFVRRPGRKFDQSLGG